MSSESSSIGLKAFLDAAGRVLPAERILLPGMESFSRYSVTTLPIEMSAAAALLPESVEQIQSIVRMANEYKVPLYPISRGNNWGYGCALPVRSSCVVLDLARMNRIVEVNQTLAYAVVEPGVSQGQLHSYLQTNNIPLVIDVTGAGPNASLLGNALERGYGIGVYADHFASMCGMEVVLSNGEILRTGFGHFEGARCSYGYKYGVGPSIDGLFSQSNFGIVTKIGLWLQPEPAHLELCVAFADDSQSIGPLVEAVRQLLLEDTVRTRINVLGRNRMVTVFDRLEKLSSITEPMSEQTAVESAAKFGLGEWNVMFALFGTKEQVAAAKRRVRQVLSPMCRRIFIGSEDRIRLIEKFGTVMELFTRSPIKRIMPMLRLVLNVYRGNPATGSLRQAYWRNHRPPSTGELDPARDGCGLIWYAPIIPMESSCAIELLSFAGQICRAHGIDFAPTLTTVNARCFDCTVPILFNHDDPTEAERAMSCYKALAAAGREKGYYPYRLGIHAMEEFYEPTDPYWQFLESVKSAVDPEGILAPGRYVRSPQ